MLLRAFSYWDFPKGMVEADEDPFKAALREVEEETGLTLLQSTWGKSFFETKPYGKGKVARYYIVEVMEDKEIKLIPNPITGIIEHHEYRWVDLEAAHDMLVPRVQEALSWAKKIIN